MERGKEREREEEAGAEKGKKNRRRLVTTASLQSRRRKKTKFNASFVAPASARPGVGAPGPSRCGSLRVFCRSPQLGRWSLVLQEPERGQCDPSNVEECSTQLVVARLLRFFFVFVFFFFFQKQLVLFSSSRRPSNRRRNNNTNLPHRPPPHRLRHQRPFQGLAQAHRRLRRVAQAPRLGAAARRRHRRRREGPGPAPGRPQVRSEAPRRLR